MAMMAWTIEKMQGTQSQSVGQVAVQAQAQAEVQAHAQAAAQDQAAA